MKNFTKEKTKDIKIIIKRFKKRDFGDDTGQAIRNSTYQLANNIVMKLGSLIFTIIIAKMLLPEKYGLYALALSTIMLFTIFSDLGLSNALLTFGSKTLGKRKESKAKGYLKKLLIWKIKLLTISSGALLFLGYFIAKYWYSKPIFYALLVGVIYIPILGVLGFLEIIFRIENKFKYPLIKEIFFQIIKLILVPLTILILLSLHIKNSLLIAIIFIMLTFCYFISLIVLIYLIKQKSHFIKAKSKNLTNQELRRLKRFILPLSAVIFSGFFFNFVDIFMLGRYIIDTSYIGYYSIAFTLSCAAAALLGFISAGFAPIFAKLNGAKLEKLFQKSRNFVISLSIPGGIVTYILAPFVINIIDTSYASAVPLLRLFAILVAILPAISIYSIYYISREKTPILAKLIIGTTLLNIFLNYIFITIGLRYSMFYAVFGACVATIISRIGYLSGLVAFRK